MKKKICLFLALMLCLCACGKEPAGIEAPKDEKAAEVFTQIKGLYNVTLTSGDAISSAEAAYEALTEKQKAAVTNYNELKTARNTFDRLTNVYNLIESIGTVTAESEAAITAAEEAYDLLPEREQDRIPNADKLTAARAAFNAIGTAITLDKDNFAFYFDIKNDCAVNKSESDGNYGTRITGNIIVEQSETLESVDGVAVTVRVHYSVGRIERDETVYTAGSRDVSITLSEETGSGSVPFNTDTFTGAEDYPTFEIKSYEVISASGTALRKSE